MSTDANGQVSKLHMINNILTSSALARLLIKCLVRGWRHLEIYRRTICAHCRARRVTLLLYSRRRRISSASVGHLMWRAYVLSRYSDSVPLLGATVMSTRGSLVADHA